jgi:hypothetical protein
MTQSVYHRDLKRRGLHRAAPLFFGNFPHCNVKGITAGVPVSFYKINNPSFALTVNWLNIII